MVLTGESIGAARSALGLSLPDVAERTNLDAQTLVRYESGEQHIPGDVLWRISASLGVPFEDIDSLEQLDRHLRSLRVRFRTDEPHVDATVRFAVARAAGAARQLMELEAIAGLPNRYASLTARFAHAPEPPPTRTWVAGRDLAIRLREQLGVAGPVPSVMELVSALGIGVLWQRLPGYIAGYALSDEIHGPTIVLNVNGRNVNELVRRFTLLHEVCHVLYDRGRLEEMDSFDRYDEFFVYWDGSRDPREIRANAFAIHVLAPEDLLRSQWHPQRDLVEAIRSLMEALGIGYEAARNHLANYDLLSPAVEVRRVPTDAPDEFKLAESSELWYPAFDTIPIERRHAVASLAFRLWKQQQITTSRLRDALEAPLSHEDLVGLADLYS